ncbi:MAG: hypothetical protein PWQ58_713 [Archaeoglobaceae archaeon]|nr:hypothetical protein [Archaeoglobaceae archaeon]
MIWSYRAVKNPAARKKWLTFILVIVAFVFGYGAYRVAIGDNAIRIALLLAIFSLFIFLYAIITLGKPRYYFMDEELLIYKPFNTRLSDVRGYSVDENRLIIRLSKKGLFGVKTLYFDRLEDLREAEKWLKKRVKQ